MGMSYFDMNQTIIKQDTEYKKNLYLHRIDENGNPWSNGGGSESHLAATKPTHTQESIETTTTANFDKSATEQKEEQEYKKIGDEATKIIGKPVKVDKLE
jgi:hypothetical protein